MAYRGRGKIPIAAQLPDVPVFTEFIQKQSNVSAAIRYLIMDYMHKQQGKPEDLSTKFDLMAIKVNS